MKNTDIYQIYYRRYPYPFRFGSYHAILRSLTIANLVERLYSNSRLASQTYQRLLRTRQLIRVLIYHDLNSSEVQRAIDHINKAHASVQADNDDYLYVLSTFFLEPLRWNSDFGNQAIESPDIDTLINFWCVVGERMNIRNLRVGLMQWKQFQHEYEDKFMAYSDPGRRLAEHSINDICRQAIPFGLKSIAKQLLLGTLDDKVRRCLQLKKPWIPPRLLLKGITKMQTNFEPKVDIVGS